MNVWSLALLQKVRLIFHRVPFLAITLFLVVVVAVSITDGEAVAHSEDFFCGAGGGLDPELCRQLSELNSDAQAIKPLLDDDGNVRSPLETAALYVSIGVQHILPGGADHILFVLALFLASERVRSLIIQISAFTLAHTATLGLAAAGVIEPPASVVEPLIALSIAFVAVENVFLRDISSWRPFIVLGFGLVHGMGFAGFIREVGLPPEQFWSSLIGFNLGVEFGQLAVVLGALLISIPLKKILTRSGLSYRTAIVIPASILISAIGLWWAIERSFG